MMRILRTVWPWLIAFGVLAFAGGLVGVMINAPIRVTKEIVLDIAPETLDLDLAKELSEKMIEASSLDRQTLQLVPFRDDEVFAANYSNPLIGYVIWQDSQSQKSYMVHISITGNRASCKMIEGK